MIKRVKANDPSVRLIQGPDNAFIKIFVLSEWLRVEADEIEFQPPLHDINWACRYYNLAVAHNSEAYRDDYMNLITTAGFHSVAHYVDCVHKLASAVIRDGDPACSDLIYTFRYDDFDAVDLYNIPGLILSGPYSSDSYYTQGHMLEPAEKHNLTDEAKAELDELLPGSFSYKDSRDVHNFLAGLFERLHNISDGCPSVHNPYLACWGVAGVPLSALKFLSELEGNTAATMTAFLINESLKPLDIGLGAD